LTTELLSNRSNIFVSCPQNDVLVLVSLVGNWVYFNSCISLVMEGRNVVRHFVGFEIAIHIRPQNTVRDHTTLLAHLGDAFVRIVYTYLPVLDVRNFIFHDIRPPPAHLPPRCRPDFVAISDSTPPSWTANVRQYLSMCSLELWTARSVRNTRHLLDVFRSEYRIGPVPSFPVRGRYPPSYHLMSCLPPASEKRF